MRLIAAAACLFCAPLMAGEIQATLTPTVETAAAPSREDAADDPAIWPHPVDPALSLLIGTNKKGGLMVMDMQGNLLDYLKGSTPNNVDIRENFPLDGAMVPLVVASDRTSNSLLAWRFDADTRKLIPVPVSGCAPKMEVYGVGMYHSPSTHKFYAFITSKPGRVEQWELRDGEHGIDAILARAFEFGGQNEGCVADDERGVVYVAEEVKAIWRLGAEPDSPFEPVAVDSVKPEGRLSADIEGLALCRDADGRSYLVASSQGESAFYVYDASDGNACLGRFEVGKGDGIDAVTGTDGIDVSCANVGPGFEDGVFVVQDDKNNGGNQNFKLVPWRQIRDALAANTK